MPDSESPRVDSVMSASSEELKSIVHQGFDKCAPEYKAWQSSRGVPESVKNYLSRLFSHLRPNASVLELGCGPGIPCTQLLVEHDLELNVIAIDVSASQISLAQEWIQSPRVEFFQGDMTKLEYPEAKFDAVVAFYSIFHLPKDDQSLMVKRITKWLKPGGVLLMNLKKEAGDEILDGWMGVRMFSSGFGVEGNLKMMKDYGEELNVEAELVGEKLGLSLEQFFHWIWAIKK